MKKREIDIEDLLVWTFRDQRARAVLGGRRVSAVGLGEPMGRSRDGVATMERIGALGCMVGGGGGGAADLHDDAEMVHAVVMGMRRDASDLVDLVVELAEAGAAPEWGPAMRLRCVATYGWSRDPHTQQADAHELAYVDGVKPSRRYPWHGAYVAVSYLNEPAAIAHARQRYAAWREGLAVLAEYFRRHANLLQDIAVVGPGRPLAPWA